MSLALSGDRSRQPEWLVGHCEYFPITAITAMNTLTHLVPGTAACTHVHNWHTSSLWSEGEEEVSLFLSNSGDSRLVTFLDRYMSRNCIAFRDSTYRMILRLAVTWWP